MTTVEKLIKELIKDDMFASGIVIHSLKSYCDSIVKNKEQLIANEKQNEAEGKITYFSITNTISVAENFQTLYKKHYEDVR